MTRVKVSINESRGIIFEEPDGTITRLVPHMRQDFMVEQRLPDRDPVTITTYSNSGSVPFALFVKFCLLTRARVPALPKPVRETSRLMRRKIILDAEHQIGHLFPSRFSTDLKSGGGLNMATAHLVKWGKEPRLEFRQDEKVISFSAPVAQKMAAYIPRIAGEGTGPFRIARRLLMEAARKGTLEPNQKLVWETRPRQKEFDWY
ncbi:MAG: hypothetical protein AABX02_03075, partial [archaeon]